MRAQRGGVRSVRQRETETRDGGGGELGDETETRNARGARGDAGSSSSRRGSRETKIVGESGGDESDSSVGVESKYAPRETNASTESESDGTLRRRRRVGER